MIDVKEVKDNSFKPRMDANRHEGFRNNVQGTRFRIHSSKFMILFIRVYSRPFAVSYFPTGASMFFSMRFLES